MTPILIFLLAGFSLNLLIRPFKRASIGAVYAWGITLAILIGFFRVILGLSISDYVILSLTGLSFFFYTFFRNENKGSRRPGDSFSFQMKSRRLWQNAVIGMISVVAILCLYRAVGYPTINYDVLSYHLRLAEGFRYHETAGALLFSPEIFYARLPLGAAILESHYITEGNAVGRGIGINLFICSVILAGAFSMMRCIAYLGGRVFARGLGGSLYASHPLFLDSLMSGLYDPILALLAVASLEIVLYSFSKGSRFYTGLFVAGLLAGSAFSIKYNAVGVVLIPVGLLVFLFSLNKLKELKDGLGFKVLLPSCCFAGGCLLVMLPWLIRAYIVSGHPLHPFAGFTDSWSSTQAAFVVDQHKPLSPFSIDYISDVLVKTSVLGFAPRLGEFVLPISLFIVSGLVCLFRRELRTTGVIFLAGISGYFFWCLVSLNPSRFLTGVLPLLLPSLAIVVGNHWKGRVFQLASTLLVVFVWFNSAYTKLQSVYDFPVAYGAHVRETEDLAFLGEDYSNIVSVAADRAESETVMLFFEGRLGLFPLNSKGRTVWDKAVYGEAVKGSETPKEFAENLARIGVTHIFVNEHELSRLLKFYGPEEFKERLQIGGVSLDILTDDQLALTYLSEYPPHRFAELEKQDLQVLLGFLRYCRSQTQLAVPGGQRSEIWFKDLRDIQWEN